MEQRKFLLSILLLLQLICTPTNGLGQSDPQITLYYSDTRHTYKGQSASNYLEIPVATTNIRLTCEGTGIRWVTPRSVADNINDNQWGTLTVKLLTIGETGLYKCYGAEGISSVYIQAKGLGMYVMRSDKESPERIYPSRNYFISDEQDITYKFFCLMSNPYSLNVPSWTYPKYVRGTKHTDKYAIESEYEQGATSLSVKDSWSILLSGRYTCTGENTMGVVTNVSINIWSHATPIQRASAVPPTTRLNYNSIETTEQTVTETDPETASSSHPTPKAINVISTKQEVFLSSSATERDQELPASTEGNLQKQDASVVVGFALALSIAITGWIFSTSLICCLWCYIRRRRVYKLKGSKRSLSLKETSQNSHDANLNNSNNSFMLNGYYPCKMRNFDKEPSPVGSTRSWACSTPTYRVQSQEMLI